MEQSCEAPDRALGAPLARHSNAEAGGSSGRAALHVTEAPARSARNRRGHQQLRQGQAQHQALEVCSTISSADCRRPGAGVQFCVLDISAEGGGVFHIWGTTAQQAGCHPSCAAMRAARSRPHSPLLQESLLIRVPDFQPSFWIAAPQRDEQARRSAAALCWATVHLNRLRAQGGELDQQALGALQQQLNRRGPAS